MARLPKGTKQRNNGTYERRFTFKGKRVSVYGNTLKELDTKEFEKRKELESKEKRGGFMHEKYAQKTHFHGVSMRFCIQ